jgi:hypothetical protein
VRPRPLGVTFHQPHLGGGRPYRQQRRQARPDVCQLGLLLRLGDCQVRHDLGVRAAVRRRAELGADRLAQGDEGRRRFRRQVEDAALELAQLAQDVDEGTVRSQQPIELPEVTVADARRFEER